MKISHEQLLTFLQAVDGEFPVPLSARQELSSFAAKLLELATLCPVLEDGRIVALAAGYTDHMINNMAYLSIVSTLPCARRKGYAARVIREFMDVAARKGAGALHLYAVGENLPAIRMYERLGFVRWDMPGEPRPEDVHLIYYLDKEVQQ